MLGLLVEEAFRDPAAMVYMLVRCDQSSVFRSNIQLDSMTKKCCDRNHSTKAEPLQARKPVFTGCCGRRIQIEFAHDDATDRRPAMHIHMDHFPMLCIFFIIY